MKNSMFRVTAVCLLILVAIITPIQLTHAGQWVKSISITYKIVNHAGGNITREVYSSNVSYGYHQDNGSHQHPEPDTFEYTLAAMYICYLNSTCQYCE